jgi:hypothetical protein
MLTKAARGGEIVVSADDFMDKEVDKYMPRPINILRYGKLK